MRKTVKENLSSSTLECLRGARDQLLGWSTALGEVILELGLSTVEYGIDSSGVLQADSLGHRLIEKGSKFVGDSKTGEHSQPALTRFPGRNQQVLDCCVAYNKYGAYCIPLSSCHRTAAQEVLGGGVYEEETISYISQECGRGDIVHAGTYFGDFIPALSDACAPNSKVWAFEPHPENYKCASITVLLNGIENVELRHAGLGETNGTLPLTIEVESGLPAGGKSTFRNEDDSESRHKTINSKITRIDDIVPESRHVSVIQLDVEGFEEKAIAGAKKTINRCRPIIILESRSRKKWIDEKILERGYVYSTRIHTSSVINSVFKPE